MIEFFLRLIGFYCKPELLGLLVSFKLSGPRTLHLTPYWTVKRLGVYKMATTVPVVAAVSVGKTVTMNVAPVWSDGQMHALPSAIVVVNNEALTHFVMNHDGVSGVFTGLAVGSDSGTVSATGHNGELVTVPYTVNVTEAVATLDDLTITFTA
jgi:hypothetical protein